MTIALPDFIAELTQNPALFITVLLTLGVILVNGWTDAPNAIATCVSTRSMGVRPAIIMAAVFNFLGVLVMTAINKSVAETIYNMVDFGGNAQDALVALCAAMFAIVVWATLAWWFGIPTSESHALIAGISGGAIAIHNSLSGINGEHRPGIVHRIDKDTSGLLVVAKNDSAHQSLAAQIAAHTAYRGYEAIVVGSPREDSETVDKPIARHKNDRKRMAIVEGGREAITHYTVLKRYRGYTHMAFQLETGRTHQIRVHMASIGHPIIGDPVYGLKKDRFSDIGGQCLHAAELTLTHPKTGERMTFSAALPDYFVEILQKLERMQ